MVGPGKSESNLGHSLCLLCMCSEAIVHLPINPLSSHAIPQETTYACLRICGVSQHVCKFPQHLQGTSTP